MSAAHTPVNGSHPIHDMTIRQHYAGLAMQGIIAADPDIMTNTVQSDVAGWAVCYADCLIDALNSPAKPAPQPRDYAAG